MERNERGERGRDIDVSEREREREEGGSHTQKYVILYDTNTHHITHCIHVCHPGDIPVSRLVEYSAILNCARGEK